MPDTVFTVGHGTRPAGEFVEMLLAAGVRRLLDVRTAPGSRRNPQYAREALAGTLEVGGIAYEWRKDLGGFRSASPDSPHGAIRNARFRGYADYMDTRAFHDALVRLEASSCTTPTAVMCAETLWWRCHRRMIADALVLHGWRVIHLLTPGKQAEHTLHPAARSERGRPVYDVGVQSELA